MRNDDSGKRPIHPDITTSPYPAPPPDTLPCQRRTRRPGHVGSASSRLVCVGAAKDKRSTMSVERWPLHSLKAICIALSRSSSSVAGGHLHIRARVTASPITHYSPIEQSRDRRDRSYNCTLHFTPPVPIASRKPRLLGLFVDTAHCQTRSGRRYRCVHPAAAPDPHRRPWPCSRSGFWPRVLASTHLRVLLFIVNCQLSLSQVPTTLLLSTLSQRRRHRDLSLHSCLSSAPPPRSARVVHSCSPYVTNPLS